MARIKGERDQGTLKIEDHMLYYWYRLIRILIERKFQQQVDVEEELTRMFRVGISDCDGLRVMAVFKYATYMDFVRWELITRSKLYNEIVLKGLAPTLGSQKVIYKKPLKLWTKFNVRVRTVGWDERWVYNVHKFEQAGELKAIGITRALVWRRDKPQILLEILRNSGVKDLNKKAPDWVLDLFKNDKEIISS